MTQNENGSFLRGIPKKITISLFMFFIFWNLFTYFTFNEEIISHNGSNTSGSGDIIQASTNVITLTNVVYSTNVITKTNVVTSTANPTTTVKVDANPTNIITKTKFATKTVLVPPGPSAIVDPKEVEEMNETVSNDPNHYENKDALINQKYCGSPKCYFLFPFHPPEQETNCNKHFLSFTQLAEVTNRTVVLTNVGDSRIWSRRYFPFNFYYDVDELQKRFPKVRFITQKDFQNWCHERFKKPQTIFMLLSKEAPHFTVNDLNPKDYINGLYRIDLLNQFEFVLNDQTKFQSLQIKIRVDIKSRETITKFFKETMNVEEEVILITHFLRDPLFGKRLIPIPYAKHLMNSANSVIENHLKGSYIGIHWRMERGRTELMPDCARRLVEYLKNLTETTGIENIYFATDYPISGNSSQAQSDTFHKVEKEHREAIQIFYTNFTPHTWVSTKALDYLYKYPAMNLAVEEELSKGGVQGIMDKLILMQADYFISGPEGCCRYSSTFTRAVMEARRRAIGQDNERIKNTIDRW